MTERVRIKKKSADSLNKWSVADSLELYGIDRWGLGLFTANERGNVCLRTEGNGPDIDLKELVDEIRLRDLQPPVLIHFTDILRQRINLVAGAFQKAFEEYDYDGDYRGVYPIKVNQHRHVLEDIIMLGRTHHFGLECGSKPELLIAVALLDDPEAIIICNGFKDRAYIETALSAVQLGHRILLVVEKPAELPLILKIGKEMRVEPLIGIRMKLATRGKGLWEASGGEKSKFGLHADEIVQAMRLLRQRKKLKCLQLLHFHIGSQITDIQAIKAALREASRFYVEICRMGADIRYLDVGGGLAVDYDGSQTNFASSANYHVGEYASDVVGTFATACREADLPHPTIVSETGRALVAHHSLLVLEATGMKTKGDAEVPKLPRKAPEVVQRMHDILNDYAGKNFQETYHDALEARNEALLLFNLGHLSLEHRANVERCFWAACRRILDYVRRLDYVPDELAGLERLLCTDYFCNFSLFQSLPDHWAVKQLFPVAPLHRLDQKPTEQGVLNDLTCDSDGVIDHFVDLRDVRLTLPLHPLRDGDPYYIGVFLVGAYQEILGDLHNLFGDTNVVHVSSGENGYVIDKTQEGDSIVDVLGYIGFSRRDILAALRKRVESALQRQEIAVEQSTPFMRRAEQELDDYTYLQTRDATERKR